MYELIQVSDHCYYVQSPAKAGLVVTADGAAVLIDSGSDKDAGKKIKRQLDADGRRLKAIYNTHSHADHIGGNRYLQEQTGCAVYAPGIERAFTEAPVLEPTLLYGGDPPAELRHKFLMAQPSGALPLTPEALPPELEAIPLPGHSFDMVGFRTAENVIYLADCVASAATLEKYGVTYLTDVAAYLRTLEEVKRMQAALFVPAHAEPTDNIAPLAELNENKVHEIGERILSFCAEPAGFETLLKRVFDAYGLTMTFEQYVLVGSTVRSYLTWLQKEGRVRAEFSGNALYWRAV